MERVRSIVRVKTFLLACALCFASGIIGTYFSTKAIPTWYDQLHKASFTPPDFIFGPVWTILYLLMAISLYLFWIHKKVRGKIEGEAWFKAQLSLNTLWCVVFFGAHNQKLALLLILALFVTILGTIYSFWRIRKLSAVLLAPYLVWVGFASILNFFVVLLNP